MRKSIVSEATKWRQHLAPGERWLAVQAERNPGLQRQQRSATSDRFTNRMIDAESQTPPTPTMGKPAPPVMLAFQSVATR